MKNLLTKSVIALLAINGALFAAVERASARVMMYTCSIEVESGQCVCQHTIVAECDPDKPIGPQCQVQCALH
jgi:hypothetical protein